MATKKKNDSRLGWHFLPSSMKLGYTDGRKVVVGQTLTMKESCRPSTCSSGMHASEKPLDAIAFHKGPVMCRVRVSRDIDSESDKFCGRDRTVLWAKELSEKDLRRLGKDCGIEMPSIYDKKQLISCIRVDNPARDKKINDWLLSWALTNGCPVTVPAPVPTKPPFDGKALAAQLMPRTVRTRHEILRDIGQFYDMTTDGPFDDAFDYAVDELDGNNRIIVIENFTKDGCAGYLLHDKR